MDITTPALLFPAIAILMLGYINRYLGTAQLIRTIKKDYDRGYKRVKVVEQLAILAKRIQLSKHMLLIGGVSLMLACVSMLLIFTKQQTAGSLVFGGAVVGMVLSLTVSIYETSLSNKSLLIEVNDVFEKEKR